MSREVDKNQVFNHDLLQLRRARFDGQFANYAFLHQHVFQDLCDRLMDFTDGFENVFVIGIRLSTDLSILQSALALKKQTYRMTLCALDHVEFKRYELWAKDHDNITITLMQNEILPQTKQSYDLIIHHLHSHYCNDVPGLLLQMQAMMLPDGVYLGSLYGGETLTELRQSLAHAEMAIRDGIAPHIAPFATLQDAGALMQRCHFTLPVVDYDTITVSYQNIQKMMHDLRHMGEGNCLQQQEGKPLRRDVLAMAETYYHENFPAQKKGRIRCSFDVIYMTGRKVSDKQQTPLKPGQGDVNLADVLAMMPQVEPE